MGWIPITAVALAAILALGALLALLVARERLARSRFQVLADLAAVSDADASFEETLESICDVLVPTLADFCMIDVIADGEARRAAARIAPGGPPGAEAWLAGRSPSIPEWMVGAENGSLKPRFFEQMTDDDLRDIAHDAEDLAFLRELAPRSTITVALNARGRVTGTLTLGVAWSGRRFRREDARFAWVLSGRVALALDNSGLFADLERAERARAEIAETLQRGLLPSPLPHIPGWSIAAMYRPAGAENEVGGDFYDVFRVPGGWMMVIGDVTGRGARAATITAVARYTLRTAAVLTDDPLVALRTLNRALLARGDTALCSLAAMTLSEDRFEPMRLAVAGHPPPLLVDGEEIGEVAPADPVLGAFADAEWGIARAEVAPGQQLVVVTDGITEMQGGEGRFGESRLRSELRGADSPGDALQRLEGALHSFTAGRLEDDVAILAISRASNGPDGEAGDELCLRQGERLYEAFNDRDAEAIAALCDDRMEFYPAVTAEAVGREAPYSGPEGLNDYLADVARVWEDLRVTPSELRHSGDTLLVRGRVYARSRELGIRDMPVAWVWELRDGRFVRGEVFTDPERALTRFPGSGLASAG